MFTYLQSSIYKIIIIMEVAVQVFSAGAVLPATPLKICHQRHWAKRGTAEAAVAELLSFGLATLRAFVICHFTDIFPSVGSTGLLFCPASPVPLIKRDTDTGAVGARASGASGNTGVGARRGAAEGPPAPAAISVGTGFNKMNWGSGTGNGGGVGAAGVMGRTIVALAGRLPGRSLGACPAL